MADGVKFPISLLIRALDVGATANLKAINDRLAAANKPLKDVSAQFSRFASESGLGKVQSALSGVGDRFTSLLRNAALLGFAGLGAGVGLLKMAHDAEQAGSRLHDLSNTTGLSVDEFAQFQYAARLAGVGAEEFSGGMEKFNLALSQARRDTGPLAELLSKVGTGFLKQIKGTKSNAEAFELLAEAMNQVQDPGKRLELARAAFGRGGAGLINVLKDGRGELQKMRGAFFELSGVQQGYADGADELGDATDKLEVAFTGLRNTTAGALFPALTELAGAVTTLVVDNRDGLRKWAEGAGQAISAWVKGGGLERLASNLKEIFTQAKGLVDSIGGVRGLAIAFAAISAAPLVTSLVSLAAALVGLSTAMGAAGISLGALTLAALPWIAVAGGLAALGLIIYKNWEPIKQLFSDILGTFKEIATNPLVALKTSAKSLFSKGTPEEQASAKQQMLEQGFGTAGELDAFRARVAVTGARSPAPAAQSEARARVQVDFANMPAWASVRPDRDSSSFLDVSVGRTMAGVP